MYSFGKIGFHVLGMGRAAEIRRWCEPYQSVSRFNLMITPSGEIIIHTRGLLDWDETLHNRFCEEFNLILFKVSSITDYYNNDCKNYINLHYGFVFDEKDKFKDYILDWDSFALDEPSSLKYVNAGVEDIHKKIEALMGEYMAASREYGCSDDQKEYYKLHLDALYELNRRIL